MEVTFPLERRTQCARTGAGWRRADQGGARPMQLDGDEDSEAPAWASGGTEAGTIATHWEGGSRAPSRSPLFG